MKSSVLECRKSIKAAFAAQHKLALAAKREQALLDAALAKHFTFPTLNNLLDARIKAARALAAKREQVSAKTVADATAAYWEYRRIREDVLGF